MVIGFEFIMYALVFVIILSFASSGIKVLPPFNQAVYLRLNKFVRVLHPGVNFITPWVNKIVKMDMRTQTVDVHGQELIIKGNNRVSVGAVVFIKIKDPRSAYFEVKDYYAATVDLAKGNISAIIGYMDFENILATRESINAKLKDSMGETMAKWGIEVEFVALREVSFLFKTEKPKDDVILDNRQ